MKTGINIIKHLLIVLGCLAAIAMQKGQIPFNRPLLLTEYVRYEMESIACAEESQAEVGLAEGNSASLGVGHEANGEVEGEKFFGYNVFFAVAGCIYFASILKVWPFVFGKPGEEHQ